MNKIHKSLHNQAGFILLLILIIATVIMFGVLVYLYRQAPDSVKPDIFRTLEEKVKTNVNENVDETVEEIDRNQDPAEVAITKDGFMPATISIVAGQQVTFVNEDRKAHRVIAYPLNKSLPELDSEDLQPTDSFTYSFE